MMLRSISHRSAFRLVVLAAIIFALYWSVTAWFRHVNFFTSQYDLGNMDQIVWQSVHGHWFSFVSPNTAELQPRAAVHTDFLLLVATPFYLLWPDPRILMFIQILVVASGGMAVYLIGRKWAGPWLGLLGAGMFFLYPPLLWSVTFDVHAVVMATPLFLWAWWAMLKKRWLVYGLFLFAAALAKEEVGLLVAALGVYTAVTVKPRRIGFATIIFGLAWSAAMIGWVIPQARQAPGHFALDYFAAFGQTPGEVVGNVVSEPLFTIRQLVAQGSFGYVFMLLWPVAGLALLNLPIFLLAVPALALNILSNNPNLHSIYYHYTSTITPFIIIAAVSGVARLDRWLGRWPSWRRPAGILLGLTALAGIWAWAPLPLARHRHDARRVFSPNPYRGNIAQILRTIPPDARVAVTNNLGPHVSRRPSEWLFPLFLERADVVLVLLGGTVNVASREEMDDAISRLQADPQWQTIYHRDQLWYFRRLQR